MLFIFSVKSKIDSHKISPRLVCKPETHSNLLLNLVQRNQKVKMMFDLSLDTLDSSIQMAEQILKKKAAQKKAAQRKKSEEKKKATAQKKTRKSIVNQED
jgi:hypothetical protein